MKHATGNFIIIMDADLSHHVSGARSIVFDLLIHMMLIPGSTNIFIIDSSARFFETNNLLFGLLIVRTYKKSTISHKHNFLKPNMASHLSEQQSKRKYLHKDANPHFEATRARGGIYFLRVNV